MRRAVGAAIIIAFHVVLMIIVARDMGAWWWGPALVLGGYAGSALLMLSIVWVIAPDRPPRRGKRRGPRPDTRPMGPGVWGTTGRTSRDMHDSEED